MTAINLINKYTFSDTNILRLLLKTGLLEVASGSVSADLSLILI